jgi:hypothetical protein
MVQEALGVELGFGFLSASGSAAATLLQVR